MFRSCFPERTRRRRCTVNWSWEAPSFRIVSYASCLRRKFVNMWTAFGICLPTRWWFFSIETDQSRRTAIQTDQSEGFDRWNLPMNDSHHCNWPITAYRLSNWSVGGFDHWNWPMNGLHHWNWPIAGVSWFRTIQSDADLKRIFFMYFRVILVRLSLPMFVWFGTPTWTNRSTSACPTYKSWVETRINSLLLLFVYRLYNIFH